MSAGAVSEVHDGEKISSVLAIPGAELSFSAVGSPVFHATAAAGKPATVKVKEPFRVVHPETGINRVIFGAI